jgi:DNA replication protein DnaC
MKTEIQNDTEYIAARLKQFKLVDMRHQYEDIASEAESEGLSYIAFLKRLLEAEEDGKRKRRQQSLMRKANFEAIKYLEDIDYGFNASIDQEKIAYLGKLDFIDRKENIIIIGPPGVGKTMIATGLGVKACMASKKVLFTNAKDMLDKLQGSVLSGTLKADLKALDKVHLLIIDELSYINMDKERESLFFQIIRQRYEKGSLIITTNLPLGRWNELFTGQLAATAILDRLVHHCHILSISGNSYRVKGPEQIKEENL